MQSTKQSYEGSNSQYSQSGNGSGDLRYKKALKQISKLINLNSSLKRQAQTWQENYHKLEEEYERLVAKQEEQQSKIPQHLGDTRGDFLMPLTGLNRNNLSIKKSIQQQNVQTSQQIFASLDQNKDRQNLEQIKFLTAHVAELQHKINEKQDIINELQEALENKHSKIIELEGRCGDLNEELFRSKTERDQQKVKNQEKERQSNITLAVSEELMKQKRRVEQLEGKLAKSEEWSRKIESDYEYLRKQIIFSQQSISSSDSASVSTISGVKIPNMTRIASTQSEIIPQLSQVYKKIEPEISPYLQKEIELELNIIRKDFDNKKSKYRQSINRYKSQIAGLNTKVASMLQLIHKQQEYIESFAPTTVQIN